MDIGHNQIEDLEYRLDLKVWIKKHSKTDQTILCLWLFEKMGINEICSTTGHNRAYVEQRITWLSVDFASKFK